ncbi:MAG: di-heme oxidoredictase family protein [Methylococcales bacterium]
MKLSILLFSSGLLLSGLLIGGCKNSGENNLPKPPPVVACPPARTTVPTDAQDSMEEDLKYPVFAALSAFKIGDDLFGTSFTAAQGGGANVDGHERYTRVPRADRTCPGEWATHTPKRPTGPNSQSCVDCHSRPNDGAGPIAANAQRDPLHSGDIKKFIQRNTPHLFGIGTLQLLGEEMTAELKDIRKKAEQDACGNKKLVERPLKAKGVDFGVLKVSCQNGKPYSDPSRIKGVSPDLIVRPLQWKKTVKTVRDFVLDAARNELGMQGVEDVHGPDKDGDGDGVVNELTESQVTALTVYMALQPRPVTRVELTDAEFKDEESRERLNIDSVSDEDRQEIDHGAEVFAEKIGCDECHKPQLTLSSTKISEPSGSSVAIHFDLATDGPDNPETLNGNALGHFTETDANGQTVVRLYGDLKRHNMGPELAEAIDEPSGDAPKGIGRSTFGTKELWGVGCTGPWLHDGRATTLTEAILYHGGEADNSRKAFKALEKSDKHALFTFLYNQVLYLHETTDPDEDEVSDRAVCGKADDEFKTSEDPA